jgi:ferredoxin-NADP reductase
VCLQYAGGAAGEPCLRSYSLSGATNRYYRITVKRVRDRDCRPPCSWPLRG